MPSSSSFPRIAAIIVALSSVALTLVPSVAMASAPGVAPGTLPLRGVALDQIVPANATVTAVLPHGPQRMTATLLSPSGRPLTTATGYVNFTGADQAGCSSDVIETSTSAPGERIRVVRPAYGATYSAVITAPTKPGSTTPRLHRYFQMGLSNNAPSFAVLNAPGATPGFFGAAIAPVSGSGWCLFDELARYTTFANGVSGPLVRNVAAATELLRHAADFNLVNLINAARFPSTSAAALAYYTLTNVPAPSLSALFGSTNWSLTRHGTVVTFVSTGPVGSKSLRTVVTFSPAAPVTVSPVTGESVAYQVLGAHPSPATLLRYLTTLH